MKVYVLAYFVQNLGDDLFVLNMVRRYPDVQFICGANPVINRALLREPNLKVLSKGGFYIQRVLSKLKLLSVDQQTRRAVNKCDMAVWIGGSLFIERGPDQIQSQWQTHRKEYVIGANFGPYKTDAFVEKTRKYFSDCQDVCLRDRYSYNMFCDLPNVRCAPDVLFGYDKFPPRQKGNGVGISVIAAHTKGDLAHMGYKYYDILAEVCDRLLNCGIPVKLFSFCEQEGDMLAVSLVLERMKRADAVTVCGYDGNVEFFLDEMNACEYMIATRFHAMVLAWAMGKRVLPVIYSKKQTHVLEDVAYQGYIWDLLGGQLPDAEEIVLQTLASENTLDTERLAKEAEAQFEAIDLLFRGK